jgi:hypothetical protein
MRVRFSSVFKADLLEGESRYGAISERLGNDFHERVKEAVRVHPALRIGHLRLL